jgi:hypothetical protein
MGELSRSQAGGNSVIDPNNPDVEKKLKRQGILIYIFKWMAIVYAVFFAYDVFLGRWYAMVHYATGSACVLIVWYHKNVYLPDIHKQQEEFKKAKEQVRQSVEIFINKTISKN